MVKENDAPTEKVRKKVRLQLVGLDGNAFSLMGAFKKQARIEGWSHAEISAVIEECMKGDYDHLLCTLTEVCDDPEMGEDSEDVEDVGDEDLDDDEGVYDEEGDEEDEEDEED